MSFEKVLNILYVGTLTPHTGGTAIINDLLLKCFAKLGHKIRALAPITSDTIKSFSLKNSGISTRRYVVPYFQNLNWSKIPDEYRELEGEQIQEMLKIMIEEEQPDIIMIGRESFAWHVPDLAKIYSIPSVLAIHGTTPVRILNGSIPEEQAERLMEQYKKVDRMVVVAKHLVAPFNQLGFSNVDAIPNGVDLQQFYPSAKDKTLLGEFSIQEDQLVVVHASNLKDLKRPLDIVHSAINTLRKASRLVYVIVGDGPFLEKMKEACRQNQILDKFRFVGWVDYKLIPRYLNLADIVLMPSEEEVQSLVYLETQACGRLLIASDIPAAREVIINGETGLLFKKGSIKELTEKTLLAIHDSKLREHIGSKAREQVKRHDINDTAGKYLDVFKKVLANHYFTREEIQ